jgi:hypothetical protein
MGFPLRYHSASDDDRRMNTPSKGDSAVSRKNLDPKSQPLITEAAEKAELLIRGLQNRLAGSAESVQLEGISQSEPAENLDLELEGYFAAEETEQSAAVSPVRQMRRRIVDGVVDKILSSCDWSQDGKLTPQFESEVMERLVEKVFERMVQLHCETPERSQREMPEPIRSPARPIRAAGYRT